ncbi:SurA N-terminal domain-containing protein [Denitromonas iodatirespirans]|uniref:Periplasmic chaperone PpiD n=1 Tax=Denitromonas iodatirespirans TaxID=2795389 RepID=A0A944D9X7_DENI1|nr:SurA N-terminal domain-containing protein [Denitromonas iodatirespirans]MBT0961437.1 SurA N-terminal domain-containing protein [Denitromonas iodatirespirans]
MFEAVRNNKRVAQVILVLISVTFGFFGIESYLSDRGAAGEVATVGGSPISTYEFEQALREQQDRIRASSETPVDSATFEDPLFRRAVLDNLVNQRLLSLFASEHRMSVSDAQLRETIANIPAFQDDGQFSNARYQAVLRSQGMNELGFQERLRGELAYQQVLSAMGEASLVPRSAVMRVLSAQLEERTVHMVRFEPAAYLSSVEVSADALKAHYEANKASYAVPARVKVAYVVLSADSLKDQVTVSDDELRAEYEQTKATLGSPEERKARHILVQVAADASEADVAAAKQKAEGLLAQIKADPSRFAELAKSASDDPGSAANGGDLGFFARGAMLKPFEDAAFALQVGEVSGLVRSDFGFHIIRVDEIRKATIPTFEEARPRIEAAVRERAASRRFAESAEQFANLVYEQPDSLEPAANQFGLKVRTTDDWVEQGATTLAGFESPALVEAVFSPAAITDKHNTDAIDVGNNTIVAARVTAHEPARQRDFDEVKSEVESQLRQKLAAEAAAQAGAAQLAALEKGDKPALKWGEPIKLQRGLPMLPPNAMAAVFAVSSEKVPGYTGVAVPGAGYALFRVDAVKKTELSETDPRIATVSGQYAQLMGAQDLRAFLTTLREQYPVKINAAALATDSNG